MNAVEKVEITLEEEALAGADGDMVEAVNILTARILSNGDAQRMMPEWARAWAYDRVHELVAQRRRVILREAPSKDFGPSLQVAMRNEIGRYMNTPIFGGKRLGDATPDEVRESARRYGLLANDANRKARWYEMIADAASKKGDAPISKTLSEQALAQMWEQSDA